MNLEQEILAEAKKLNPDQQRLILAYARALATRPKGMSGKAFLEATQNIHIDPDDLKRMEEAIEAEFEQVRDLPEVDLDG